MIDRVQLNKILDARDALEGVVKVDIQIYPEGNFRLWVTSEKSWETFAEDARHKALAVLTPLVGKIEHFSDTDWRGEANDTTVYLSNASACKIVGYKKEKRVVQKEIEKPKEYEEVEEEVQVAITDCDIKQGRATADQIEVPA